MLDKKALALIVSLLMLVSGVYLAYTYSSVVHAQQVTSQGTLPVSANGYQ